MRMVTYLLCEELDLAMLAAFREFLISQARSKGAEIKVKKMLRRLRRMWRVIASRWKVAFWPAIPSS